MERPSSNKKLLKNREKLLSVTLITSLLITAIAAQTPLFSPDSWGYFGLAKTIFTHNFYQHNYEVFVEGTEAITKSKWFPFGYPIALGLLQKAFGEIPSIAIYFNIFITLGIWNKIIELGEKFGIDSNFSIAIAASSILNPYFLDEVFAGRSIPLAFYLFLYSIAISRKHPLIGGVFLGLAAITRSDYLVIGACSLACYTIIDKKINRQIAMQGLGFATAVSPWIIYSYLHFSQGWGSYAGDAALSQSSDNINTVIDFLVNTGAKYTVNLRGLITSLIETAMFIPASWMFLLCLLQVISQKERSKIVKIMPIALTSPIIMAPYVLTGYHDGRYFTTYLSVIVFTLAWILSPHKRSWSKVASRTARISSLLSLIIGVYFMTSTISKGIAGKIEFQNSTETVKRIEACHRANPSTIVVFDKSFTTFPPFMYGALTGLEMNLSTNINNKKLQEARSSHKTPLDGENASKHYSLLSEESLQKLNSDCKDIGF